MPFLGDESPLKRQGPSAVRIGMVLGLLTVLMFAATTLIYLQPDLDSRFDYAFAVGKQHLDPPADEHLEAPADEQTPEQAPSPAPEQPQEPAQPPPPGYPKGLHRQLASLSTTTGDYSHILLGEFKAYNPNLIPHPTRPDAFIVMAQKVPHFVEHVEISCTATFAHGDLVCEDEPYELPIPWPVEGHCTDAWEIFNNLAGPRDGRLAFGPDVPYAVYGGLSSYGCLGMWVQDLPGLSAAYNATAPPLVATTPTSTWFHEPTELDRPDRTGQVDKNYFLFWDAAGNVYVHVDLWPARNYAQLDAQGHVTPNLNPGAAGAHDAACMAAHFPRVLQGDASAWDGESIHQATNALAVTMCRRADPTCHPDPTNTFIAHIFHKKNTRHLHTSYEPFIMLFDQTAPFALHAVASAPYWIQGRKRASEMPDSDTGTPAHEPEMVYITSMSWKALGNNYHGYLDDRIFLAFGIEDTASGLVEVEAASLFEDLAFC